MTARLPDGPRCGPAIAVFNDEAGLPVLLRRLDASMRPRVEAASGNAVIVIDADLQGPPEVVLDMIARWKDGYEVVYGRRLSRECESRLKTVTASVFYKLLVRLSSVDIPRDSDDFRLIDRKAMEAFRAMPERDRFVRGMFGGPPQIGRACDDAFCLGRGERKVALQAELLVLVSWAVALPSTFRGLKIEYFIVTDPLIVIAAALLVARVLAVQTHRFAYPAAAALIVATVAAGVAEPVKHTFRHDAPFDFCVPQYAYTKRIQTFSFCTTERKP